MQQIGSVLEFYFLSYFFPDECKCLHANAYILTALLPFLYIYLCTSGKTFSLSLHQAWFIIGFHLEIKHPMCVFEMHLQKIAIECAKQKIALEGMGATVGLRYLTISHF